MLDTRFPRLVGDIGNPAGFNIPVLYQVVEGASPERVVLEQSEELIEPFIDAGMQLIDKGATVLTTSCGFLALFQKELQASLPVPIFTSSLLLMPDLEARYGKDRIGILTISRSSLNKEILVRSGISPAVPVGTTEGGREFTNAILENRSNFDVNVCRQDNVDAAISLLNEHPAVRALLLECTNMPPYADAIEHATSLPVYSLNTLLSGKVG